MNGTRHERRARRKKLAIRALLIVNRITFVRLRAARWRKEILIAVLCFFSSILPNCLYHSLSWMRTFASSAIVAAEHNDSRKERVDDVITSLSQRIGRNPENVTMYAVRPHKLRSMWDVTQHYVCALHAACEAFVIWQWRANCMQSNSKEKPSEKEKKLTSTRLECCVRQKRVLAFRILKLFKLFSRHFHIYQTSEDAINVDKVNKNAFFSLLVWAQRTRNK